MRVRRILLLLTAALGAALLPLATAGAAPAPQASPQATLVRTHVFHPAPGGPHDGKPAPATANCSPDDGSQLDVVALTGFEAGAGPHQAHFNAATTPATVAGSAAGDLQAGFDVWTAENPAAPTFTVVSDGTVTKATANRQTDLLFGRAPGNSLAVTYTWQWSDGLVESDTVFSTRVPWADITEGPGGCNLAVPKYDLQNIAAHEFGHIYGLDHPAGDRFATMYAFGYTGETLKRTLSLSDENGIHALY